MITVDSALVAAQVNVRVDLSHAWIGDLAIDLASPTGTSLSLHTNAGGEANDIRVTYSDDGVANGASPYDFGCFMQPSAGVMADLAGPAQGEWILTLTDTYPAADDGLLEQWCVRVFDTLPFKAHRGFLITGNYLFCRSCAIFGLTSMALWIPLRTLPESLGSCAWFNVVCSQGKRNQERNPPVAWFYPGVLSLFLCIIRV